MLYIGLQFFAHKKGMGEELQTDIQHNSVPSFLIR